VVDVVPALRQSQRGSVGDRKSDRLRSLFVVAEVALSLTLLVGTGLLVRSLVVVLNADRGFTTDHRLVAAFSIPSSYAAPKREQIVLDVIDHIKALPGVVSVGFVSGRPLRGYGAGLGIVAADHNNFADKDVPWASWRLVTEDYFTTMGLSIVAGRGFTNHDRIELGTPTAFPVIISQRLATLLWPGQDPIGRQAVLWKGQGNTPGLVLGVVQDMREQTIEGDPTLAVYFPARGRLGVTQADVVIHTRDDPARLGPQLRSALAAVDPGLPIFGIRTLDELVARSVATRRFTVALLGVFAGVALFLAIAGVYGVVAYTVARKTGEIGVRLALGATPSLVLARAVVLGLRPVVIGAGLGLIGMIWVARLMSSLLVGVTGGDLVTYAAATIGLLVTAALACYLPARQVLRVDPVIALRAE
jgi:predicted permease